MRAPIYKNGAQIEFCDLLEKAESAGFRPADIARMLGISKASVSKIKQAKQTPRPAIILSLKKLVEEVGTSSADDVMLKEQSAHYADKIFKLPANKRELAKNLIDQLSSGEVSSVPAGDTAEKLAEDVISYSKRPRKARAQAHRKVSRHGAAPKVSDSLPAPINDPKQHPHQT